METIFDPAVGFGRHALVALCLALAFGFEFVNGFHDTANAVATVIYTESLKPWIAVVLSGVCNFLGVFLGGIAVAIGIIKLLPVELVASDGVGAGLAMVLALLLAAIIWNFGTWWFGLPASSSHTLIGAIVGVGLANSLTAGHQFGQGVNWGKAGETGLALIVSPAFGFIAAGMLVVGIDVVAKRFDLHKLNAAVTPGKAPPWSVRSLLIATCAGLSFAHGSNDGQKGVGLVMLILMALVPGSYALDVTIKAEKMTQTVQAVRALSSAIEDAEEQNEDPKIHERCEEAGRQLTRLADLLEGHATVADVPRDERFQVRQAILLADKAVGEIADRHGLDKAKVGEAREHLRALTDYAPRWVLIAIAVSLGMGTMIGWRRIVVTVGERIGKQRLTYAQGASAGLVATATIGLSGGLGLPVSTTHVLSSGVAGTMVAEGAGVQGGTVRNIALAWILTLPISMLLAGALYLVLRLFLV